MVHGIPTKIGKYEVLEVIGRGGMGTVYKARDPLIGRLVAIKMLTGAYSDNPDLLKRFYREVQSTGSLQHPNIVTVYDLGDQDGIPYFVMEYLEGVSANVVIHQRSQLSVQQKLNIAIEVCRGLAYAHQRGIVHRDIKPGNIMLLKDGGVKIVDFGIAQIANESLTATGQVLGSLTYMSPEQVNGYTVDARSDIFSLGAVLYELLAYRQPFQGKDTASTLMKIIHDSPPPIEEVAEPYRSQLQEILSRALAKDRAQRYQTADALADDLRKLSEPVPDDKIERARHLMRARAHLLTVISDAAKAAHPEVDIEHSSMSRSVTIIEPAIPASVLAADASAKRAEHDSISPSLPDSTAIFQTTTESPEGKQPLPSVKLTVTSTSAGAFLVGASIPLTSAPFRIGRHADMSVADAGLSREHAVIDWDGEAFTITDLGSKNGTYVNGRRLRSNGETLPFGSIIRLGNSTALTFSSDEITELPDLTGQLVADRYKLTRVLRNGSKTALYEASDSHLPQLVAVKVLSPSLARYAGYLQQFNREAETAVRLRHPHICRVLDYGQASVRAANEKWMSVNYISMELMEGGDLSDYISKQSSLSLTQILSWLDDITNALEYAHRRGVTHNGLKLSSIVFDREGEPYVTDFAIASRVDEQMKHVFFGSPEFLAPEQWEGAVGAPSADQYSLAVLTYFLLAGSFPFEGQIDPKVREKNFARSPLPAHEEAVRMGRPAPPTASFSGLAASTIGQT